MAKTYYVAVNWGIMLSGVDNTYLWLRKHAVNDGNDMAQLMENFPYSKGWRVYPFTRKKDRDEVMQTTMNRWIEIKKEEKQ